MEEINEALKSIEKAISEIGNVNQQSQSGFEVDSTYQHLWSSGDMFTKKSAFGDSDDNFFNKKKFHFKTKFNGEGVDDLQIVSLDTEKNNGEKIKVEIRVKEDDPRKKETFEFRINETGDYNYGGTIEEKYKIIEGIDAEIRWKSEFGHKKGDIWTLDGIVMEENNFNYDDPILDFDIFKEREEMTNEEKSKMDTYEIAMEILRKAGISE